MYILLLLIIDQVAKWLAKVNLQPSFDYKFIPNILSFTYVENTGIAFGMLNQSKVFVIIFTLILILALLWLYIRIIKFGKCKKRKNIFYEITFSMLIAGAIGNFFDRIFRGYVVDFIKLDFIDFPIYNIADIYICVSCILIFIYVLLFEKDNKNNNCEIDNKDKENNKQDNNR